MAGGDLLMADECDALVTFPVEEGVKRLAKADWDIRFYGEGTAARTWFE
jgi:hypothetical protein